MKSKPINIQLIRLTEKPCLKLYYRQFFLIKKTLGVNVKISQYNIRGKLYIKRRDKYYSISRAFSKIFTATANPYFFAIKPQLFAFFDYPQSIYFADE